MAYHLLKSNLLFMIYLLILIFATFMTYLLDRNIIFINIF